MKARIILLIVATIWLAPSSLSGQSDRDRESFTGDPVELLLSIRRELRLDREQVATLRDIQRRLERANRPLVERLIAIQREVRSEFASISGSSGRRDPVPSDSQLAAARAPLRRIQENNVDAMEAVGAVLTARQKRAAQEILEVRRRSRWRLPGD